MRTQEAQTELEAAERRRLEEELRAAEEREAAARDSLASAQSMYEVRIYSSQVL